VLFFTFATMVLAVALDSLRGMKGLVRGLFFYPYILSILVSALLFQYLANYREGAINTLLRVCGLEALTQDWMGDPNLVPYFIFALVAWSATGFFTTLYLANLQTIPTDLYEAARIDGAGPWSVFTHIQFPMLLPTITTNSALALITGINLFPQIVVTTQGGPGYRTFTIGYYIYHLGVLNNRQGYAAAVSFVTFAALLGVAAVQVALLRRRQVSL
jgi:ABC-type sugar transport system permease subunit